MIVKGRKQILFCSADVLKMQNGNKCENQQEIYLLLGTSGRSLPPKTPSEAVNARAHGSVTEEAKEMGA